MKNQKLPAQETLQPTTQVYTSEVLKSIAKAAYEAACKEAYTPDFEKWWDKYTKAKQGVPLGLDDNEG